MFIKVKAFPQSKQEKIEEKASNSFDIYVREEASDGKANKRIIEIMRGLFKGQNLRLIAGHKTQNKIFEVVE